MNTNSLNSFEVKNTENKVQQQHCSKSYRPAISGSDICNENTSKRPCTTLSPLSEDESGTKLLNLLSSAVEKAIKTFGLKEDSKTDEHDNQ